MEGPPARDEVKQQVQSINGAFFGSVYIATHTHIRVCAAYAYKKQGRKDTQRLTTAVSREADQV